MRTDLEMNKYQTVFTDEDFKDIPKEIKGDFYEVLESIKFVNWLIQPEEVRGFAKNRPKYKDLDDEDPEKKCMGVFTQNYLINHTSMKGDTI